MSKGTLAAMLAWLGSIDHGVRLDRGEGFPAYKPKRTKLKGYQKAKKRRRK